MALSPHATTTRGGVTQGMQLEEAETLVKSKRSQAHPYIDCWKVSAESSCRMLGSRCDQQVEQRVALG